MTNSLSIHCMNINFVEAKDIRGEITLQLWLTAKHFSIIVVICLSWHAHILYNILSYLCICITYFIKFSTTHRHNKQLSVLLRLTIHRNITDHGRKTFVRCVLSENEKLNLILPLFCLRCIIFLFFFVSLFLSCYSWYEPRIVVVYCEDKKTFMLEARSNLKSKRKTWQNGRYRVLYNGGSVGYLIINER